MTSRRWARPSRLGDAAAARAVKADRVDLVEIGERAVGFGDVADLGDGRDVAVHGIDRLEGHELGPCRVDHPQLAVEILRVVVAEDVPLGAGGLDAFDHRGMVLGIRQHDAARQLAGQRAQRRPVRDVAGGEEQGRLLAVEVGELLLQKHVVMVGAGNVAGTASPGAAAVERLVHGVEHDRVLAHPKIVVGAPDRHRALAAGAVMSGVGEAAVLALEIGEDAVAALAVETGQLVPEECLVVHGVPFPNERRPV